MCPHLQIASDATADVSKVSKTPPNFQFLTVWQYILEFNIFWLISMVQELTQEEMLILYQRRLCFRFLPRDAVRKRGTSCRPVFVSPLVLHLRNVLLPTKRLQISFPIVKLFSRKERYKHCNFLNPSVVTKFQGKLRVGR